MKHAKFNVAFSCDRRWPLRNGIGVKSLNCHIAYLFKVSRQVSSIRKSGESQKYQMFERY